MQGNAGDGVITGSEEFILRICTSFKKKLASMNNGYA